MSHKEDIPLGYKSYHREGQKAEEVVRQVMRYSQQCVLITSRDLIYRANASNRRGYVNSSVNVGN